MSIFTTVRGIRTWYGRLTIVRAIANDIFQIIFRKEKLETNAFVLEIELQVMMKS